MKYVYLLVGLFLSPFLGELTAQVTTTVYFNDFESSDGGLVAGGYGDWEWGDISTQLDVLTCDATSPLNPPAGFSGTQGWANNLDGCYDNAGDSSYVSLTVDLSDPTFSSAEVSWIQWHDIFTNFDFIWVTANGVTIYSNDSTANIPAWEPRIFSLNQFVGQSIVELRFYMFATTVVNRAGWYIDDLSVTASDGTIGIEDQEARPFSVWPNPTNGQVNIHRFSSNELDKITVVSSVGSVVLVEPWNSIGVTQVIDLSGLPNGMYAVIMDGPATREVQQIILE